MLGIEGTTQRKPSEREERKIEEGRSNYSPV